MGSMAENEDREENRFSSDVADNHQWADRLATDRQKHLERFALIAIAAIGAIVAAVIVVALW